MSEWIWEGKPFTSDMIGNYVGFVYCILFKPLNKKYLGRTYFHQIRKVKGKKRRQRSESNWKKYWSSSEVVKNLVELEGEECFDREIISLHTTRGDCNYMEVKLQFQFNVLESEDWLNDNINGKWHRKPEHILDGRVISEEWNSKIPVV